MKKLLLIFLLLLLAIGIGWGIHQDSGNVLVTFQGWQIETSLWMATLLLVVFFTGIYALIRFLVNSSQWPKRWRQWRQADRRRRAERSVELAICDLIEGKHSTAEQYLNEAAAIIHRPLLCYLGAAMAAQAQGRYKERDTYLRQAYQSAPEAQISLGILQAKLQVEAQQHPQALATLRQLQHAVPHHPIVKKLLNESLASTQAL